MCGVWGAICVKLILYSMFVNRSMFAVSITNMECQGSTRLLLILEWCQDTHSEPPHMAWLLICMCQVFFMHSQPFPML